jgi:hypothetical protein
MSQNRSTPTTITDIDIPFGRLVVIILKTMLASIPAIILFYALFIALALIIMAVFGGGAAFLNSLGNQR